MTETTLSVRLPAEVGTRLDRLARDTSVSKSKLATDAIVAYLDEQERQLEKNREGLADAEAGRRSPSRGSRPLARLLVHQQRVAAAGPFGAGGLRRWMTHWGLQCS